MLTLLMKVRLQALCFYLAAVFAGAGLGTDSHTGGVFVASAIVLLMVSPFFAEGD